MKTIPIISVVVLCYNHEKLLGHTLDFFEKQTCKEFELILIDNNSSDGSFEILEQFEKSNPTMDIKVIRNTVSFIAEGRKLGVENSNGMYVMLHDGDDWIEYDCIEKYRNIVLRNEYPDCVYGGQQNVDENGNVLAREIFGKNPSFWMKNSLHGFLFKKELFTICVKPFYHTFWEDFYVCMELKPLINSAVFLPEFLYNYYSGYSNSSANNPRIKMFSFTDKSVKRGDRFATINGFWVPALEDIFCEMKNLLPSLQNREEAAMCEYQFIRHYYSCIFTGIRGLTFKQSMIVYKKFRQIMRKYYPQYYHNSLIKLFGDNGYGGRFKRNIWLCAHLERMDIKMQGSFFMSGLILVYLLCDNLKMYKK